MKKLKWTVFYSRSQRVEFRNLIKKYLPRLLTRPPFILDSVIFFNKWLSL
jgi:hypothetical protein